MKTLIAILAMVGALTAWAPTIHAQQYPADNSGKNVRDRNDATKTTGDQSNAKSDVAITQEIRKAVVADKSLSTNAHNVKIITLGGIVTLRGPVASQAEKTKIASIAAQHAGGATKVKDQIEVAP